MEAEKTNWTPGSREWLAEQSAKKKAAELTVAGALEALLDEIEKNKNNEFRSWNARYLAWDKAVQNATSALASFKGQ